MVGRWHDNARRTSPSLSCRCCDGQRFQSVHKICRKHGFQMKAQGPCPGSKNGSWKGGRKIDKDGYVLLLRPDHPHADRHGYVREHRLVVEQAIGRHLRPEEVVHHKDDDTQNNAPTNLVLYATNADHLADTLVGKCPNWTIEGQARIAEGVRKPRQPSANPRQSKSDGPSSRRRTVDWSAKLDIGTLPPL